MSGLAAKREAIRRVVLGAIEKAKAQENGFTAISRKIGIAELFEEKIATSIDGWPVTELFDVVQGVTWGGEGCEEIYVIDKAVASSLESKLLYRTVGGRDIGANVIDWKGECLVFPYIKSRSKWIAAFRHSNLGGDDALDFSRPISNYEKGKDVGAILNYRIATGIVDFPNVAKYLVQYYNKLEQREFEGKKLSQYHKCWYEYHRPRTPILITKPKIVCKRLMRTPAFALDEKGYLPRDSVISLIPKKKLDDLSKNLEKILQSKIAVVQALKYSLAFLNSELFQVLLDQRRSKKRGGYPIVDERLLQRFSIPKVTTKDSDAARKILQGVAETADFRSLCRQQKKNQTELSLG